MYNYAFIPIYFIGPVAQWIRHLTSNQGIAGSSPARVVFMFLFVTKFLKIKFPPELNSDLARVKRA